MSRAVASTLPCIWRSSQGTSIRAFSSSTARHAKTLLYLEHRSGKLNPASLNALTAAKKLGEVDGVLLGSKEELEGVKGEAKKLPLQKLLVQTSENLAHSLPEPSAPVLAKLIEEGGYTHFVGGHTATGKNIFPRVAAKLDVEQISDVSKVLGEGEFERPIYAGNALATVSTEDKYKVLTIRASAFEATKDGSSEAELAEAEAANIGSALSTWISDELVTSTRPDLGSASRVVSGGRALKNKENFDSLIVPLADAFGAAVGASRAAVDSGYADNSLQVGQTGKVVAPELYVAVGISGAIQHLAGMKDSKVIVAINKDPEAPIFQVADVGLVADLYDAVPELTEKVKQA
ncbi:putative electron transfer flavoprotein alpha subunit [Atractiella rhizophila]|nr:putative electron transfer flavoprotein alpha subunit [Atractiella rhizophila]